TDLEVCWVPMLVPMSDFRIYRVDRDDALILTINEREEDFMERVRLGTPPEPVSADDAKLLWPRDKGGDVVASQEVAAMCEDLKDLKANIKEATERAEGLADAIKLEMKGASRLVDQHRKPLATWKSVKPKKCLDGKKLQLEYPTLYNHFSYSAKPSRQFLVK
ncbi:MAG: hypothetical protein ACPG77_05950, partial [Nannocystaceae bacterium]